MTSSQADAAQPQELTPLFESLFQGTYPIYIIPVAAAVRLGSVSLRAFTHLQPLRRSRLPKMAA